MFHTMLHGVTVCGRNHLMDARVFRAFCALTSRVLNYHPMKGGWTRLFFFFCILFLCSKERRAQCFVAGACRRPSLEGLLCAEWFLKDPIPGLVIEGMRVHGKEPREFVGACSTLVHMSSLGVCC